MNKGKVWYKSKSVWLNVILTVITILSANILAIPANISVATIAILNIILRIWFTSEPIVKSTSGTIRKSGILS